MGKVFINAEGQAVAGVQDFVMAPTCPTAGSRITFSGVKC